MRDFLMREKIEEKDGIKVTRTRTSSGYAAITVQIDFPSTNGGDRTTTFTFSNDAADTDYERRARLLVDALDAIRSDPCNLPDAT